MEQKSMREIMENAKKIYFVDEYRTFMRGMQGFADEDFERVVPIIKEKILSSEDTDPFEMFERVMKELSSEWNKSTFPVHGDWHHYIVPGVVMASLRNCGYEVSDRDIEEAMARGEKFPGGSCGFAGTCGGAYSVGIILSMVKKTTPIHETERSEIMRAVVDILSEIEKYPRRCCKRSSYIAIEQVVDFLKNMGYEKISCGEIKCLWSSGNRMCLGIKCPYYLRKGK